MSGQSEKMKDDNEKQVFYKVAAYFLNNNTFVYLCKKYFLCKLINLLLESR